MIQGTVMCRDCLKKVTKEAKDSESSLIQNMANEIIKENTMSDVYD